jgi:hypothetical protein
VLLIQAKHKLHVNDSLQLGHAYYEKIREQSAAYKAPQARFAVVSNARKASVAQKAAAAKHQIDICLREELDELIGSLS